MPHGEALGLRGPHNVDGQDDVVERAIAAAVKCGEYHYWARKEPSAARGLLKMAAKSRAEHQAATALIAARASGVEKR